MDVYGKSVQWVLWYLTGWVWEYVGSGVFRCHHYSALNACAGLQYHGFFGAVVEDDGSLPGLASVLDP